MNSPFSKPQNSGNFEIYPVKCLKMVLGKGAFIVCIYANILFINLGIVIRYFKVPMHHYANFHKDASISIMQYYIQIESQTQWFSIALYVNLALLEFW